MKTQPKTESPQLPLDSTVAGTRGVLFEPGTEVFRKTGHGYQKVKLVVDYTKEFPAVRVRTLDKAAHEWLIKPSEILTVAEKLKQDEIVYVGHFPDILKAWNGGERNRRKISEIHPASYGQVRKVIKLALRHNLITK